MQPPQFRIEPSSPWMTPMGPILLRGGLRKMVSQWSDGTTNILTPRAIPSFKKSRYTYVPFPVGS